MYYSLKRNCQSFHLYVFAFDEACCNSLIALNLDFVTVISLEEFEDDALLEVKDSRGKGEYCWTCTPSTILYCIKAFDLDHCTYIDADLYFFSDPSILIEEMRDRSVLITSHRYTPRYDQTKLSGIYCVQFVTFKNNNEGLKVLNWWRNACIEWCFARSENGKFGDQKYLDNWPTEFEGIHELKHLGGGVAPWNVQQYDFRIETSCILGVEKETGQVFNLVFYHFHGLRFLKNNKVDFCEYQLSDSVKELIYKPYLLEIEGIKSFLHPKGFNLNLDFNYQAKKDLRYVYITFKKIINKEYHIYKMENIV
jgi:hypothetical protein